MREKLKDTNINPITACFISCRTKSDREKLPYPFKDERSEYRFSGLYVSKEIRPWMVSLLNDLLPELENRGVKFTFEESNRTYGNYIDVFTSLFTERGACFSG